jgi:hypothetical protein
MSLNDVGEDLVLQIGCKLQKLNLKCEYCGPRTLLRNGKVECKLQTLYGKVRAMLNDSSIEVEF